MECRWGFFGKVFARQSQHFFRAASTLHRIKPHADHLEIRVTLGLVVRKKRFFRIRLRGLQPRT